MYSRCIISCALCNRRHTLFSSNTHTMGKWWAPGGRVSDPASNVCVYIYIVCCYLLVHWRSYQDGYRLVTVWLWESELCGFESWSSQTNDLKIDTYRFLARAMTISWKGQDWIAQVQCQDNVTEWDIRSLCSEPGLPVGQHYPVAMSAHCHTSVLILLST